MYELLAIFAGLLVLATPVLLLVLLIVAIVRSQRIGELERRLGQIETQLRSSAATAQTPVPGAIPPIVEVEIVAEEATAAGPAEASAPRFVESETPSQAGSPFATQAGGRTEPRGFELAVGRSVLGWVAVVALVLASAAFLKYAFDNQWIGPQGQLAMVLAGGMLILGLAYRHAIKGWRLFAQFLFSAGLVVLYLATYGAFGFYHVVSQEVGLIFLLILVVEAALLALAFEAWPVALVALLGGLATPLLVSSPHDEYVSLFIYLALLNGGAILILCRRQWPAIGTVALLGAHGLFAIWYPQYFHPEKLAWALGLQAALWGLHLGYHALTFVWGSRKAGVEDLIRLLLVPVLGFAQVYNLLLPDYAPWLGTVAVLLAIVYAVLAHAAFQARPGEDRSLLTLLAVVLGLVGVAIPLEARADWVALGWAIMGASLWWFGIRVERGALRGMGAVVGLLAVLRMVLVDTPQLIRSPFSPILNEYALPALGVVACLLGSAMLTWSERRRITSWERTAGVVAGLLGAILLGWVISWDIYGWFAAQARRFADDDWNRAGQVAVSVWWAIYATALLAVGFRARRPIARWLALGLFALTAFKVFFIDLATVGELYRILALFCLAILLGGAAWAYQRVVRKTPGGT